jgi:hypothetical protein
LAREAQAAGLLAPEALSDLLKDAMRRRAVQDFLAGVARGRKPLSMSVLQSEVKAVRRARRNNSQ